MSVYFAESCGFIKIGYSKNPFGRVGSITRLGQRPADIPEKARAELIGWVPGDRWREGEFHAQFADCRVAGEWFRFDRQRAIDLIWADPCGYDFRGMTLHVGMASLEWPGLTRDEMEQAGIRIHAYSLEEQRAKMRALMDGAA